MAQRVKLYEEKKVKKGLPLWAWVLAIVLAVALIVFFFSQRNLQPTSAPTITPAAGLILPSLSPAGPRLASPVRPSLALVAATALRSSAKDSTKTS